MTCIAAPAIVKHLSTRVRNANNITIPACRPRSLFRVLQVVYRHDASCCFSDFVFSLSILRALTLDNTLVILSAVAPDAGRYYAQAVNDKNGENKTSQPVVLTVESEF